MFDKKRDGGGVGLVTPGGDTKDLYEGDDGVLHTVAEDLVDAIHAKDVKGVTEALKAFLACAQAADMDDQDEETAQT